MLGDSSRGTVEMKGARKRENPEREGGEEGFEKDIKEKADLGRSEKRKGLVL